MLEIQQAHGSDNRALYAYSSVANTSNTTTYKLPHDCRERNEDRSGNTNPGTEQSMMAIVGKHKLRHPSLYYSLDCE